MAPLITALAEILAYAILALAVGTALRFVGGFAMNLYSAYSDRLVKVDPFINGVKYPVSYWTEKGGRPYQEDRHHEMKGTGPRDSSLYGVFDGHGGAKAAQYCKESLLQTIVKDADFEKNPAQAIFNSYYKSVFIVLLIFHILFC